MQFKTIFTVLSIAAAATATPVLKARSSGDSVSCANGYTAKCCNSVQNQVLGLLTIPIGINCLDLALVQTGDGECSQTTACCQSGDQSGLVNIGNVCPVIL